MEHLLEIRAARATDATAVSELLTQLGYPADPSAVRARLQRMMSHDDISLVVAEDRGVVCGAATLHFLQVLHEDSPRGQITSLIVSEAHRRRGVGAALVRHLEQVAATRGVETMVVTTANHRAEAHRFYERLGYEFTGRRYAKQLGRRAESPPAMKSAGTATSGA